MNRRRFLLGSSALVAAAAVAKALPSSAIWLPPAPTSWGEVTGATFTIWVDRGGPIEIGDTLMVRSGGGVADQLVRVASLDKVAGRVGVRPEPALAPPASLR